MSNYFPQIPIQRLPAANSLSVNVDSDKEIPNNQSFDEQLQFFKQQLDPREFLPKSDQVNVFKKKADGKDYLLLPQGEGKKPVEILFNQATDEQIRQAMEQKLGGIKNILGQTLRQYPPEQIKFWIAQGAVQIFSCNNGGLTNFDFKASHNQPTCVDNFLMSILDIKGWIGFYFFMLGNRITSAKLTNMMTEALYYINNYSRTDLMKKTPSILAKWRPTFGYMGMAVGSMASEMVHHILTLPSLNECMGFISNGKLISAIPMCQDVLKHFVSLDRFWHDFFAGLPALIGSAVISAMTQKLAGKLIKNPVVLAYQASGLQKGVDILDMVTSRYSTNASGATSSKLTKVISVSSRIYQHGKKGMGFLVRFGTGVSSMVVFFAWDHFLRAPTVKYYWHKVDGGTWFNDGIKDYAEDAISSSTEISKLGWKKPLITEKCRRRQHTYRPRDQMNQQICTPTGMPFTESLDNLQKSASRYRNKVITNKLEEGHANWTQKWKSYVDTYLTGKIVIEHIYKKRREEKKRRRRKIISTNFHAVFLAKLWIRSLNIDAGSSNKITTHVAHLIDQLNNGKNIIRIDVINDLIRKEKIRQGKRNFKVHKLDSKYKSNILRRSAKNIDSKIKKIHIKKLATILSELRSIVLREYGDLRRKKCGNLNHITCWAARETLKLPNKPRRYFGQKYSHMMSNVSFLKRMNSDEYTINKVLRQFICGKPVHKRASGTQPYSGSYATLKLPNIISNFPNKPKLNKLCDEFGVTVALPKYKRGVKIGDLLSDQQIKSNLQKNIQGNIDDNVLKQLIDFQKNKDADYEVVLRKVWDTDEGLYADPISYLSDPKIKLVLGDTEEEARQWWNQHMLSHTLTFYANTIKGYGQMIHENLISKINTSPAIELILKHWRGNEGSNLSKKMVDQDSAFISTTTYLLGIAQEWVLPSKWSVPKRTGMPALNESLIGHIQVITSSLRILMNTFPMPPEPSAPQYLPLKTSTLINDLELAMAEHTRHIDFKHMPERVDEYLRSSLHKIVEYRAEPKQIDQMLEDYGEQIATLVHGNSWDRMIERSNKIEGLLDQLSYQLTGKIYSDLSIDDKFNYSGHSPESLVELNPEDYRIYTGLQIITQLKSILTETNNYYYNYLYLNGLFKIKSGH